MTHVTVYKPGIMTSRTSGEAISEIYRYLETKYDYEFSIVQAESDDFSSDDFEVASVPSKAWKPVPSFLPCFPQRFAFNRHLTPVFDRADAIVTMDPILYPQAAAPIKYGVKNETPVFCDISQTVPTAGPLWLLKRKFFTGIIEQIDGFIATVPKCLERLNDIGLFSETVADRTHIMGHPVDTDKFAPRPQPTVANPSPTILVISRLVPEKGLAYVIEALAPLLEERSDLTVQILGSGPLKPYLERRLTAINLRGSVEFLGTLPHDEVPEVINDSDVFLNHAVDVVNWEEFFGVANLEAMACEAACVVSDSGGIPYVIREADVVESVGQRDIVALRRTVEELLDDPELRAELGTRAREYVVDNYAVDRIGEQYHQMLTEHLN